MRKVILFMHMSLNGFVARPKGEMDWVTMNDDEMGKYMGSDLLSTVDTMLLGGALFKGFEQVWPGMAKNPSGPKDLVDFANWIVDSPKVVFSKSMDKVEWNNSRLVKGDIAEEVAKLKQQPGKDMVLFGGAGLAQAFSQLGLIDEYRIKLEPVVLESGRPLFNNLKDSMNLKLIHSKTFNSGVVGLYYQVVRK